jgi:hypothetical protein
MRSTFLRDQQQWQPRTAEKLLEARFGGAQMLEFIRPLTINETALLKG